MKNPKRILLISLAALMVGVWLGFYFFQKPGSVPEKPIVENKSFNKKPQEQESEVSKPTTKNKVLEKTIPSRSDVLLKQLKDLIDDELVVARKQCEEVITQNFKNEDYLDVESGFFDQGQNRDRAIHSLYSLLDSVSITSDFENILEEIVLQPDFNSEIVQAMMERVGVACSDGQMIGFANSFVRGIAISEKISAEEKRGYIVKLLEYTQALVTHFNRLNLTFFAMENLFSMLDYDLISREYRSELNHIRQETLNLTQDFDIAMEKAKDSDDRREILRTHLQNQAFLNESIKLTIERILSDISR